MKYKNMRLKKIEEVEKFDIYDITVENDHAFELENGIIAHNSMFPKTVMSGGTGPMYSSSSVFIIGRQQEKTGKELDGYNFVINVEKSRYVREKSKIPITVTFEKGLSKWSGLLDVALELGYVIKPKNGWYTQATTNPVTGEVLFENKEFKNVRKADTETKQFWEPILKETDFAKAIESRYVVSANKMLSDVEEEQESDPTDNE